MNFQGVYTAIITPFKADGAFDEPGFCELLEQQAQADVHGIVVLGTTAEAPTLREEEKNRILKLARERIQAPQLLIAGTGTNCTEQTIIETRQAEKMGADAALVVTPYYNKPSQEGIFLHYQTVAESSALPLLLYNISGRTGVNMQTATLRRLFDIPSIIGIKEASGNLAQMMDVLEARDLERPDFQVLSGDDNMTLPLMALGGNGVISVVSNLVPALIKELYSLCKLGKMEEAKKLHFKLLPLFKGAFIETNPIPIKTLMRFSDLPAGPCRLPLCALMQENERHLRHLHETMKMSFLEIS